MRQRIEKWDILKLGLIFLVVLGHICDQYVKESAIVRAIWLFIYSFHMPLFFFVSGLFSKKKINNRLYVQMFQYFALYIVAQLFLLLSKMVFLNGYSVELLNTKDSPWFIFVLFAYYIITTMLQRFDGTYILIGSIVLACMAGYDNSLSDMLQISRLIVFYPFFYAGYLLDEEKVREKLSGKRMKVISILMLGIFILYLCVKVHDVYWIRPLLTGRNAFSKLGELRCPYGWCLRIGYYFVAACLGMMIIALTPERMCHGWIAKLGSRSIQVYVLHRPCIILLCTRMQIAGYFERIWPSHYHLLIVPLAAVITLFCSWGIFETVIHKMITPRIRK